MGIYQFTMTSQTPEERLNIEETHNTREVDGLKEFYSTDGIPEEMKQAISFMRQWLNEDRKATPMVTARDLWHWIGPTIHHQLQKAREETTEEIIADYMEALGTVQLPEEVWSWIADINGKYRNKFLRQNI